MVEKLKLLLQKSVKLWFRAAEIPMGKSGVRLQMKLVCSNLAPFFIFLLQWMDFSCLLPRYFDFFHILIYKVLTIYTYVSLLSSWLSLSYRCLLCLVQVRSDGRWNLSRYGRKATIREFYGKDLRALLQYDCVFVTSSLVL